MSSLPDVDGIAPAEQGPLGGFSVLAEVLVLPNAGLDRGIGRALGPQDPCGNSRQGGCEIVVDENAFVCLSVSVRILDAEDFFLLYGEILPISFAVPVAVGWRVGPGVREWFGTHRLLVEGKPVLQTTDRHVVFHPGPVVARKSRLEIFRRRTRVT